MQYILYNILLNIFNFYAMTINSCKLAVGECQSLSASLKLSTIK